MAITEKTVPAPLYEVSLAVLFGAAWYGMEFSPSFTLMFLVAGAGLCALAEAITALSGRTVGHRALRVVCFALHLVGMLCAIPATVIYATGDDFFDRDVRLTVLLAVCATAVVVFKNRATGPGRVALYGVEALISAAAVGFTLLCGLTNPALLPYGLGLLALGAGRPVKREGWHRLLILAGMILIAVFAVTPALLPGGV